MIFKFHYYAQKLTEILFITGFCYRYVFNNMNILITGGSGYVVSHLCNKLSENSNITILDNFSNSLDNMAQILFI